MTKYIRRVSAILGAILAFGGVSRIDYYSNVLVQAEPEGTIAIMVVGLLLMLPQLFHMLKGACKR